MSVNRIASLVNAGSADGTQVYFSNDFAVCHGTSFVATTVPQALIDIYRSAYEAAYRQVMSRLASSRYDFAMIPCWN